MNKDITFAEKSKMIRQKYYKNRKPGEDQMTDDAFNREMKQLMMKQEAIKSDMDNDMDEYGHGGKIYIKPENRGKFNALKKRTGKSTEELTHSKNPLTRKRAIFAQNARKWHHDLGGILGVADYAKGGGLPKYYGPNNTNGFTNFLNPDLVNGLSLNTDFSNFGNNAFYNPNEFSSDGGFNYSPTANILGPALSIGTSAIASGLAARNNRNRLNTLLSALNENKINYGRVNPQQIDLSHERSDIRANAALSDANGRYLSRGAQSASEASNIMNQARLGSQRTAGSLLGQSYGREETTNAELRSRADELNRQLAIQEGQDKLRQNQMKLGLISQYGNQQDMIWPQFVTQAGQSIANYFNENQQMQRDYDYLQMMQPNLTMNYDVPNNPNTWDRILYGTGIKIPKRSITVRR